MALTSLEKLVEDFARNVEAQTAAIWRGDAKTGNKHADRCLAAFDRLCAHGDAGRDALAALFAHSNMDVRTTAAAFLLRYRTAEAKAILEEAAKGEGLVAFASSQALKRWEEGTWALDPAKNEAGPPEAARPAPPSKRSRPRTERAATDRRRGSKRDKPGG
ncbi:DUF2019 domain-containing protein [Cystobacter fuscus]|nr:DUF2019 domain-containing protein [Cystobacter fuscus]